MNKLKLLVKLYSAYGGETMQQLSSYKEAYYKAVDNTDYPQKMKIYIKKLISNCANPAEIFQLTLFYLYNCQTA